MTLTYEEAAQALRVLALAGTTEVYFKDEQVRDEFCALFDKNDPLGESMAMFGHPRRTGPVRSVDGVKLKVADACWCGDVHAGGK